MYSPKELEGEVDHSFFDSDCDGNADSSSHQDVHTRGDSPKGGEIYTQVGGEQKEDSSPVEDSKKVSDAASQQFCGEQSEANRSESEEAPNLSAQTAAESGSSAEDLDEDNEVEDDGYDLSDAEEESEGDLEEKLAGCEAPGRHPARRSGGKFGSHRSPSSSGSESSYSESGSCDSEPLSSRRKPASAQFSLSPRRQPKLAAMTRREKQCPSGESDDTVTDVTPLSTPDSSPIQSFDMASGGGEDKMGGVSCGVTQQQNIGVDLRVQSDSDPEGEKVAGLSAGKATADLGGLSIAFSGSLELGMGGRRGCSTVDNAVDLNHLLKASIRLEEKMKSNLHIDHPGRRVKKNYSFNNEEVRRIDRENQRLLCQLSRLTSRPKSACGRGSGSVSSSSLRKPGSPPVRRYHSALNRQREQQKIERENLALLKRLESVKPTVGMRRTEQLADYQRQARYLGALPPPNVMDRPPSSRSPTVGSSSSRCSASSLRRAQPDCSVSPGMPKHRRGTERRAAWS